MGVDALVYELCSVFARMTLHRSRRLDTHGSIGE